MRFLSRASLQGTVMLEDFPHQPHAYSLSTNLSSESLSHPPWLSLLHFLMKSICLCSDEPHEEVTLSEAKSGGIVIIEFVLMNAFPG